MQPPIDAGQFLFHIPAGLREGLVLNLIPVRPIRPGFDVVHPANNVIPANRDPTRLLVHRGKRTPQVRRIRFGRCRGIIEIARVDQATTVVEVAG